ncbi:hypothetical protein ARTHROSP310_26960 [Arthrobacter sp. AD-310]
MDQQPGLSGQPCQGVELAVLEAGRGPNGNDWSENHQGGQKGRLGSFNGTLQPQGHGKATVSGLISTQFHRVPWCHAGSAEPGSDRLKEGLQEGCSQPWPDAFFVRQP